jgi:dnd system-associated protein 4
MRDIRRPDDTEPLVELLTTARRGEDGEPVFQTIMDLLIFAAGVGFGINERSAVPSGAKVIPYAIFERNQKDGFIHLIAMAAAKSPTTLADKEMENAVQIFEEYASAGLKEMQRWLNANPTDTFGVSTLMTRIVNELGRNTPADEKLPSPI